MVSRTKYLLSDDTIKKMFEKAGIENISAISSLGAGEFNAVYLVIADKSYVLKIAPSEDIPVLTYEKNMMQSEVYWYEVMRTKTDIRVPEVYFSDFSHEVIPTDWFIMEKLDGEQKDKFNFSESEKERSSGMTAEMGSKIHKIHNDKFGYIQNRLYDNWYDAIRSFVKNTLDDAKEKGKKSKRGEKLLKYIDEYSDVLKGAECCMVNFDLWDPNIMCERKNGEVLYSWIDPERTFWGDRIADFVCFQMFTPLGKKTLSLEFYNKNAEKKVEVTREEKIRYAVAEGYLGTIMEVEKYYRYTPHHFGWWRNVGASKMLFKSAFGVLKDGK